MKLVQVQSCPPVFLHYCAGQTGRLFVTGKDISTLSLSFPLCRQPPLKRRLGSLSLTLDASRSSPSCTNAVWFCLQQLQMASVDEDNQGAFNLGLWSLDHTDASFLVPAPWRRAHLLRPAFLPGKIRVDEEDGTVLRPVICSDVTVTTQTGQDIRIKR